MRLIPSVLVALLPVWAAGAQMADRNARLGMLCPVRCVGPGYTAFEDELRTLGWIEGRNLIIERRAAEGRYERLPELVADLVRAKLDVITAAGATSARAAKDGTSQIPIAFSFVARPVELGLVQSLARPGGNVTGVAALTPGAFLAKQFEILREMLPQAKRVAVLANPANEDHRLTLPREIPMASQLGLQIDVIEVRAPEEASAAVARAKQLGAEGLLVLGDAVLNTPPSRVPDLLAGAAIPALYSSREPVLAGGLISYTPDSTAIARRHAHYVDRLLRGHLPTDLPVEQPTRYNLTVNLRTAAALGLILPQSLMSRADEVIE